MPFPKNEIVMELSLHPENLPVVMNMAEQAALVFGMQSKDTMALRLAAEEVFSYLCTHTDMQDTIRLECKKGIYYIQMDFIFQHSNLDLRAFNISTDINLEDDSQLEEMGLLIAARSIDRLFLNDEQNRMVLSLYKEKSYPPAEISTPMSRNTTEFFIKPADIEDLKSFCQLAASFDKDTQELPVFLRYPGKFADMIYSGEYQAALAFDQQQAILGGIVWKSQAQRTIEFYGPYLFTRFDGMAEALIESCLEQIGRSDAVGLVNRCGTVDLSEKYFEKLGTIQYLHNDDKVLDITAYYRQLCEDPGQRIWTHPDLLPYLQSQYQRLFLPREIRPVSNMGEYKHAHSVFSSEIGHDQVILRPLLGGEDTAANLKGHLQLFAREKIPNIFFEIDLGLAWHAELVPALLCQGFKPGLILPYAGKADLLLMQYRAGDVTC
ncbi:MAG TPA: hypothetical protein PLC88_07175 [Syntrophomonas sp.]|nr:hypothetical protein [Syntrophomonas sp.]